MYLLVTARKGISSMQLAKEIGVTKKTAWFILGRLREACGGPKGPDKLRGVVEIDECFGNYIHDYLPSRRSHFLASLDSAIDLFWAAFSVSSVTANPEMHQREYVTVTPSKIFHNSGFITWPFASAFECGAWLLLSSVLVYRPESRPRSGRVLEGFFSSGKNSPSIYALV